ncbi:MAG: methylated-DNA--[protein]-cysteine S-methyltransferase [Deltaproteobacteria bacterium]|nr:methylated-DNA--[protein]-cysteine S-methyltransferase [Deltaproteobacteria bacterium]
MTSQPPSIYYSTLDTPIGRIFIGSTDQGVCEISLDASGWDDFTDKLHKSSGAPAIHPAGPRHDDVRRQLSEYFSRQRRVFEIALDVTGTAFQKRVWRALTTIPYGETWSYRQVAAVCGQPQAFRAVGQANRVNPVPIVVPCHRVIGANGTLTGYAGGLEIKKALLALEGVTSNKEPETSNQKRATGNE